MMTGRGKEASSKEVGWQASAEPCNEYVRKGRIPTWIEGRHNEKQ